MSELVFRTHAACTEALRHPGLSAARFQGWSPQGANALERAYALLGLQMVFTDPPAHTRLRGLVTKAFTPRVIEGLRETIGGITESLLDTVTPGQPWDAVAALAYPLPVRVIAEMLGIPASDQAQFKRWSDDFFTLLDGGLPNLGEAGLARSLAEFTAYIRARIEPLRRQPRLDLLSALVRARHENDQLSDDELLANTLLLLAAGHETTTSLIGSGLWLLLTHPEQREKLTAYPTLWPLAVEEFLRYEPPVQWTSRIAKEPLTLAGESVAPGDWVLLELAAANRDPLVFPDPEQLDITRPDSKHLAFGYGPHYCLGAALARLEAQLALSAVLHRSPMLQLAGEPAWKPSFTFRGLERLPVR